MVNSSLPGARELVESLRAYIDWAVEKNGGVTAAEKPGHRHPFHWPPHPASYSYHVLAGDWTGSASFEAHGEKFAVEVARTPYGVFGRSTLLWNEARGDTLEEMLDNLRLGAEPLFRRQLAISECLGIERRFDGHINELSPEDDLKLLYCRDRDVANDARIQIETHGSSGVFGPALVEVLLDRRHPRRRSAQWCVLDLFEDIESFFPTPEDWAPAVLAMRGILWDAEDDYARTVYKAGVVLGGHLPDESGGDVLLDCLAAPSRIGRRAAIHGLFHVVEWFPDRKKQVLVELDRSAASESEPILQTYARAMAEDIRRGNYDHVTEPLFEGEG